MSVGHWAKAPLGDVCEINPRPPRDGRPADATVVTFVPMAAVDETSASIVAAENRPYSAVKKGFTPFRDNDVLFAKITPCMENGKIALARDLANGLGFGSTEFHVLRASSRVLPEWLRYFVLRPTYRAQAKRRMTGAVGQQRVPAEFLAASLVPLPPVPEQRRIVDLLSRAENIVRMRREAEARAKEIIPALFLDMFGDPARNERGWEEAPIGQLGRVQLGRQRAPKYQTGAYTRPYMRVANVHENRIDTTDVLSMDFNEQDFIQYRLYWGDILLNEGQSIELVGRSAMWRNEIPDCCFQNTLVRFQPTTDKMTSQFALTALLLFYHRGMLSKISSKTSNVAHLGASRFANLSMYCPPLPIQQSFSRQFDRVTEVERSQAVATSTSELAFQSLLAGVFGET